MFANDVYTDQQQPQLRQINGVKRGPADLLVEFAAAVTLAGMVPSANFAAFSDLIRDLTGGAAAPVREAPPPL